jgi:hypothetical protein
MIKISYGGRNDKILKDVGPDNGCFLGVCDGDCRRPEGG